MKVLDIKQLKVDAKGKIIEIPIPKHPQTAENAGVHQSKHREEHDSSAGFDSNRLNHMKNVVDKMYGKDEELDKEYPNVGSAKMFRDILLEREKKQMQLELDIRKRRQLNIMKKMAQELERELQVEAEGVEKFEAEIDKAMKKLELDAKKRELELLKVEIEDQIRDDNEQLQKLDVLEAENQISQLIRDNEAVIQQAETNIHTGMLELTRTQKQVDKTQKSSEANSQMKHSKRSTDDQTVKNKIETDSKQKQLPQTTVKSMKKPQSNQHSRPQQIRANKPTKTTVEEIKPSKNSKLAVQKKPLDKKQLISSQLSGTKQSFFENTVIDEESLAKEESRGDLQSSAQGESFSNNTFPSKF